MNRFNIPDSLIIPSSQGCFARLFWPDPNTCFGMIKNRLKTQNSTPFKIYLRNFFYLSFWIEIAEVIFQTCRSLFQSNDQHWYCHSSVTCYCYPRSSHVELYRSPISSPYRFFMPLPSAFINLDKVQTIILPPRFVSTVKPQSDDYSSLVLKRLRSYSIFWFQ